MTISNERMEKALIYLAQTDELCAEFKASVARTEYLAKLREATAFKTADGRSVEDRKAVAKTDEAVQQAWDEHFKALVAYEKVRAKRETEGIIIDTWRSVNANRRHGNVT